MSKFSHNSLLAEGERVTEEQHGEEQKLLSFSRSVSQLNRRRFLSTAGIVTAAAGTLAATGCTTGLVPLTASTAAPSALDILNFALNLEYLEASFYSYISTGSGLPAADMGTSPGAVSGGAKVTFSNPVVASVAAQLATDEREHVEFLRSTITAVGGTPVDMPALNLAAMGTITSDATFLTAARQLETVGVSAYAGGAQYLVTNPTAVLYGAQILDTESQHESFLRQLCISLGVSSPAVDSLDIAPTATTIFNTSSTTGLYAVRTTSQVLQLVYGASGQTGVRTGGFFPNGLNGNIFVS